MATPSRIRRFSDIVIKPLPEPAMATPLPRRATATNTNAKGTVVSCRATPICATAAANSPPSSRATWLPKGRHRHRSRRRRRTTAAKRCKAQRRAGSGTLLNDELFATAVPERSENVVSSLGAEADKVIQALNSGKDPFEDLEDPAAGLAGGGVGDQTHDFVRRCASSKTSRRSPSATAAPPTAYRLPGAVSGATTATTTAAAANTRRRQPRHRHRCHRRQARHLRRARQRHRRQRRCAHRHRRHRRSGQRQRHRQRRRRHAHLHPAANVNGPVTVTYTLPTPTAAPPPPPPPSTSPRCPTPPPSAAAAARS